MQDELAIEFPGAADAAPASRKRRTLRQALGAYISERREGIVCAVFAVSVVGALYGAVYGALAIWEHNGRTQAVQRAKKMDGEVFTIKGISSNLVGDTRLFLENARGEDCGWVMIYMSNPLNDEVNPIFLLFARKRAHFPMKVRAHYREQPHALKDGKTVERFTGSFLDFERLDD
ncbi:MAG TPA: hypothetical protein VGB98_12230 [Pyrinomonadaceae bacterium]|jgi:hypothetical protein